MHYKIIIAFVLTITAASLSLHAQTALSDDAQSLKSLYEELQGFKDDPEFHSVGFGQGGRFNSWLVKVDALSRQSGVELFKEVGVQAGDLRQLGMDYRVSRGASTSYTQTMETMFKDGLYKTE